MKQLLNLLEGSSGKTIYLNFLAMSVCWHFLLQGLWQELANANIPQSVKALDDFANLCVCANNWTVDSCIEWLLDRNVNKWAPIDESDRIQEHSSKFLLFQKSISK